MFYLIDIVQLANQKFCFVYLFVRGVKDQAPNTMDMDTQPQGQQAAVPVFQPQVTPHRDMHA